MKFSRKFHLVLVLSAFIFICKNGTAFAHEGHVHIGHRPNIPQTQHPVKIVMLEEKESDDNLEDFSYLLKSVGHEVKFFNFNYIKENNFTNSVLVVTARQYGSVVPLLNKFAAEITIVANEAEKMAVSSSRNVVVLSDSSKRQLVAIEEISKKVKMSKNDSIK